MESWEHECQNVIDLLGESTAQELYALAETDRTAAVAKFHQLLPDRKLWAWYLSANDFVAALVNYKRKQ